MKLAAVGDNCMDSYMELGKSFAGGNSVNVAVYFVRLGGTASYIGAVGTDCNGNLMLDAIKEKQVDISHVQVLPGKTAVTEIKLVNGDRTFLSYDEGVLADYHLTPKDIDFLCTHDMVVTSVNGNVEAYLPQIKAKKVPIAYDCSTHYEDEASRKAIPYVDYLFGSADADTPELRQLMKKMKSKGPKIVIYILGDKGSLAYDGNTFTVGRIVPCEVVDTIGAGDSYIAGFLLGILQKKTIAECMSIGAKNSSITLGYFGAW